MLLIDDETPADVEAMPDVVATPDAMPESARREFAVGRTRRCVFPSR